MGEVFGRLITVLFIQEIIKGMVIEFQVPKEENPTLDKFQFHWLCENGLLGVIFTFGLLYTSLKSRRARSWLYGTEKLRGFIADYGVPLMVVVWTALSFAVVSSKIPSGVPRGLIAPLAWESESLHQWTVIEDMGKVATDKCIMALLFFIVIGVIAILIVKLVHPGDKDNRDIPRLAPPVMNNRRLLWNHS